MPCCAVGAYRGSGVKAPHILYLGTGWRGPSPPQMKRMLGRPQIKSGYIAIWTPIIQAIDFVDGTISALLQSIFSIYLPYIWLLLLKFFVLLSHAEFLRQEPLTSHKAGNADNLIKICNNNNNDDSEHCLSVLFFNSRYVHL